MASLTIVVDGVEQKIPLQSATVTLGRGLESDVRLKDIKASRRHCQIVKTAKGYQCVDLSSGNGTYVNGIQIKQQMLGPGDRITIGSTTISFDDAPPAPAARAGVSPKAPTAKVPVAASAPAPAPPRHAAPKVPTENVPVAPTRRSTDRLDAVKSASKGALKPVTAPVAAKPGTKVQQKTGRTSGVARAPRPAAEAPGKKKSPVLLIAAAVVVVALGVGAWLLFGSHDSGDQALPQIKALVAKAEKADKADRVDEAIQDYQKALELCKGDRYKVRASEIKKLIEGLESRRAAGTAASPAPKDPPASGKGPDFQAKKTEISQKHHLGGDPSTADWCGALKDWNDFLKGKVTEDSKVKVAGEMGTVQAKAKEDAERLRKKAEALAQENKMAEAVDLIRQQLVRFHHPSLQEPYDDLQNVLKKYDK